MRFFATPATGAAWIVPKLHTGSDAPGNAATRIDVDAVTGGTYVHNTYPEIDGLFTGQVTFAATMPRPGLCHYGAASPARGCRRAARPPAPPSPVPRQSLGPAIDRQRRRAGMT